LQGKTRGTERHLEVFKFEMSKDDELKKKRKRGSESPSRGQQDDKKTKGSKAPLTQQAPPRKEVQLDAELTAEEIQMMVAMGIPFGFESTQGKHVEDEAANQGAVKTATKRTARQYMNRKGGFNKALPAEKTGEKIRGD
jgi:U4/U6.U5 tri-snRNP-associated protein 3